MAPGKNIFVPTIRSRNCQLSLRQSDSTISSSYQCQEEKRKDEDEDFSFDQSLNNV
jgi:hypothetical protein